MQPQFATRAYVAAVASAAAGILVYLAVATPALTADQTEAAVFFSFAAFLGIQAAYRLPRGGSGNIAFIPLLAGVGVAPSFAIAVGAGAAVLVSEYLRHRESIRIVFNAAQFTLSVGLAVVAYRLSGGASAGLGEGWQLLHFSVAYGAFFVCNAVLFSGVVTVSTGERLASVLARSAGGAAVVHLVGIPIVFGFAYAYLQLGWVWSGALLIPMFGLRQMYKVNRELQMVNEELLQLMVAAIEARDPYTSGHSQRVAEYSRVVSHAAGLSARGAERVYTAALLHDVGKIHEEFAPILRKPGRLTDEEFGVMKTHSEKGAVLVSKVSQFVDLIPAIRGHHEAWDGSGYPHGLEGERIPLWARVITFADTIDAMTTDRPYREALSTDAVRAEIRRQAGKQFDPKVAEVLISDARWPEMATAIRNNRFTHVPATAEQATMPRHSAAYETPYAGNAVVANKTAARG